MRYITITNSARSSLKQLILKAEHFTNKEFVSIHTLEKCTLRKPLLDDKKTNNFSRNGNFLSASIISQIEPGKYLIDEDESTKDQIVFYYEDKIQ